MPPKKKRDRRKLGARSYRNYSDEMLLLAIDMVKNKNMSTYDAEKQFNIPRRTIERKIKKIHLKKPGSPLKFTEEEELAFVKVLITTSDYGAPLTLLDFRIVVHEYLLKNNKSYLFDEKIPGEWWARSFIERHRDKLTMRSVQNIKRARAEKSVAELKNYFDNLKNVIQNVPATHLLNYDETNFSDNPGSVKCIFRRGIKYPERVMNSSKGSISVMFAGTADGKVLPPYVVYKSEALWSQWVEGGPDEARYNRTKLGWFDSTTFFEWFTSIIIPWARKLEGTKVIIGDNLSSHINLEVIELCEKYDIKFILLPPNSTALTQPLDVAFFGPLKKTWRKILTHYKVENPRQASLNKCHFPPLLKKVMDDVNMCKKENVVSGFRATGIYPFNPQKVFKKVPEYTSTEPEYSVDAALLDYLKESRKPNLMKRGRNKKLNVESGMSVTKSDLTRMELLTEQTKKTGKQSVTKKTEKEKRKGEMTTEQKKLETDADIIQKEENEDANTTRTFKTSKQRKRVEALPSSSPALKTPDSLKMMSIRVINSHLDLSTQDADTSLSQATNVHLFSESVRNEDANMAFIEELPKCLQSNTTKIAPKIVITSDILIQTRLSPKTQKSKQENANLKKKQIATGGQVISQSAALHMKLMPVKKEKFAEPRKVLEWTKETEKEKTPDQNKFLEDITDCVGKSKNEPRKRKINTKITTTAKKGTPKHTSRKRRKKRSKSESSSSCANSDEICIADTDDSDGSMGDYLSECLKEDQENIEPLEYLREQQDNIESSSIPYGISEIEYFTNHDNKLKTEDWILVKFATKKNVKHFVGKVIAIKDGIPEVKFVRKVKNTKYKSGVVFTYPTIDDIDIIKHLDDIILFLPEPQISRRGQIIFNINLNKYNVQ